MVVTFLYILQGRIQEGVGAHPARPPKIWKNMIFWRKIVIFYTKCPTNFRASLRSAQYFKCAPLTWNPGFAPVLSSSLDIFVSLFTLNIYLQVKHIIIVCDILL
jgi:hypothetical protein